MSKMSMSVSTNTDTKIVDAAEQKEISLIVEKITKRKSNAKFQQKINLQDFKRDEKEEDPESINNSAHHRTKMCVSFYKNIRCTQLSKCTFAHSEQELVKLNCGFASCKKVFCENSEYSNVSSDDMCFRFHENESFNNWQSRVSFFIPKKELQQPKSLLPLRFKPENQPQQTPVPLQPVPLQPIPLQYNTPPTFSANFQNFQSLENMYSEIQHRHFIISQLYRQMFSELEKSKFEYESFFRSKTGGANLSETNQKYTKNTRDIKDHFVFQIKKEQEILSDLLKNIYNTDMTTF